MAGDAGQAEGERVVIDRLQRIRAGARAQARERASAGSQAATVRPTASAGPGAATACVGARQSYRFGSQRLAMRQAMVKAGLKTLPTS
jgi:hypothetical protein